MEYRKLGKTGMSASVIGLGAEHLDNKPYEIAEETIRAAISHDINIIDVFMPGDTVRENIAKALGNDRKNVILQGHIGSVDLHKQYDRTRDVEISRQYFEKLLRIFKTDYIDLGMMFFIDTEEDFKGVFDTGYITYVEQLKRDGKIRAIGASSHDPKMARRVVETGVVDHLMFSINLAFDMVPANVDVLNILEKGLTPDNLVSIDPDRMNLYRICEQQEVSIAVMKTLGAGKLLSAEHTPFGKPMTVGQCIHYALTRPAVASVLIGCQNRTQVEEAVSYLTLSDKERDYSDIATSFSTSFRGQCVYCNHCLPCPSAIDIAALTKYLDIALLDKNAVPNSIRTHYAGLAHHASECIECGQCVSRCPFAVPVIENMQKAKELFGN